MSASVSVTVAATVTLVKAVYPRIPPLLVARALALSASYHPAGGYNTTIGFGLVNPVGALHEAGALMKLRDTAAPGQGAVSSTVRFGSGPAPGAIDAVHHAPAKVAGFAAAIVVGAALLLLALLLARRWRRQATVAAPPGPSIGSGQDLPHVEAGDGAADEHDQDLHSKAVT
jgi:hypothetical protein